MKKELMKLGLLPYLILCLTVIFNLVTQLVKEQMVAITFQGSAFTFYFPLISYIILGIIFDVLGSISPDVYLLKKAKMIIGANIAVLFLLWAICFAGFFFFLDIKEFYIISFVLLGYYLYLMVRCFRYAVR